jgi:hypothetical protein
MLKNIHTGKPQYVPSKDEIREIKKRNSLKKRRDKKLYEAEDAEEKKLEEKINKRTGRDKFVSTKALQKDSVEILKQFMDELKIPFNEKNILDALLTGRVSKKLSRHRRKDKLKILGFGSAYFYQIAAHPNPKKILHKLAKIVGVNIDRISDPCRIIVACFVDYGATKEQREHNRQYAATDARALSYIVRNEMRPQEVMNPAKGENVTVWAKREADYRSGKQAAAKPVKKGPDKGGSGRAATRPACHPFPSPGRLQGDCGHGRSGVGCCDPERRR